MSYFINFDKIAYLEGKKPEGCILCLVRDNSEKTVNLKVYETDFFTVAANLYPYNPGHIIIFPNRHVTDIRALSHDESCKLCETQKICLDILERVYKPHGYNIGYNMGRIAGASIEHLHLHVIPRYPGEAGIVDLIAGQKVLIENPVETCEKLKEEFSRLPQVSEAEQ